MKRAGLASIREGPRTQPQAPRAPEALGAFVVKVEATEIGEMAHFAAYKLCNIPCSGGAVAAHAIPARTTPTAHRSVDAWARNAAIRRKIPRVADRSRCIRLCTACKHHLPSGRSTRRRSKHTHRCTARSLHVCCNRTQAGTEIPTKKPHSRRMSGRRTDHPTHVRMRKRRWQCRTLHAPHAAAVDTNPQCKKRNSQPRTSLRRTHTCRCRHAHHCSSRDRYTHSQQRRQDTKRHRKDPRSRPCIHRAGLEWERWMARGT